MESQSKQQIRIRETQARLLDAAEQVFVRDGYEGAQLDAIAAAAGRSKGAVYTHFKSKEDLFLALYEHRTRTFVDRLIDALKACQSRAESLRTFRDFYVALVQDRVWPILTLEFKLYAVRHPESRDRLHEAFRMSKGPQDEATFEQMFGRLNDSQRNAIDLSVSALGPVLSGLILESHLEPETLSEENLCLVLGRIFDALFPVSE